MTGSLIWGLSAPFLKHTVKFCTIASLVRRLVDEGYNMRALIDQVDQGVGGTG